MQIEKKYFNGLVNTDADHSLLEANECINLENLRFGVDQALGSIGDTANVPNPHLPEGINICIGAISEEAKRYIIQFNYNVTEHGIYLYHEPTNLWYIVLLQSQVTGGLNFNKYKLIHSASIVNGILYFTDDNSEPWKLNLAACIKANSGTSPINSSWQFSFPIRKDEITLIRKPPAIQPYISKSLDAAFGNDFISKESFQFAWQYEYYDGETSVLSTWSKASQLNLSTQKYNSINVLLGGDAAFDLIPQSVRIVRLIVRVGSSGKSYVVKEWDNMVDSYPITQHNTGNFLSFSFYNNAYGEFIDDATASKPFDSVPVITKTLTTARNRLFLGNNLEGYDAPVSTSLQFGLSEVTVGASAISKEAILIKHRNNIMAGGNNNYVYAAYFVYLTEIAPAGYYELTSTAVTTIGTTTYPTLPAPPGTISLSGLVFRGADIYAALQNTKPSGKVMTDTDLSSGGNYVIEITGIAGSAFNVFKSGSQQKLGIVFYDYALRKASVVTRDDLRVSIPQRTFNYGTGTSAINWTLSNGPQFPLNEIPVWAHYYQIVRTLNLKTRFFTQHYDNGARYATRNVAQDYVFEDTGFGVNTVGVAVSLKGLSHAGLGYIVTEGDVATLTSNTGKTHELGVVEQRGDWLILQSKDIGNLATQQFLIEIYTPHKASVQEPFYEMGNMHRVSNPGTGIRSYSVLTGTFTADAYVFTRNFNNATYFAEAMSPNDRHWKQWYTDAGRINIVSRLGQVRKINNISFSNVYLEGASVNGLSSFEALNDQNLPQEVGGIMRLILTSKVQAEGNVILAVGKNEVMSVYVGEAQISDTNGSKFFVKSENVIGTTNALRGSYGTEHPECVTEFRGNVFWIDTSSGSVLQYSVNGLDNLSASFKFHRAMTVICKKIRDTSIDTVESFGGRPFLPGCVDPQHEEVLWVLPKLSANPPKGILADVDLPYPYDLVDHKAKTLVYKKPHDRCMGSYSDTPECMVALGNELYGFKNGVMVRHNVVSDGSTINRYGTIYKSRISFAANAEPAKVKTFHSISSESNKSPEYVHFRSEYPWEQSTDLYQSDFTSQEGVHYGSLFRDRLSPNVTGTPDEKMYKGDNVRTTAMLCMLQFDRVVLKFLNIGFNISRGHKT